MAAGNSAVHPRPLCHKQGVRLPSDGRRQVSIRKEAAKEPAKIPERRGWLARTTEEAPPAAEERCTMVRQQLERYVDGCMVGDLRLHLMGGKLAEGTCFCDKESGQVASGLLSTRRSSSSVGFALYRICVKHCRTEVHFCLNYETITRAVVMHSLPQWVEIRSSEACDIARQERATSCLHVSQPRGSNP
jgi:hypothetical protein